MGYNYWNGTEAAHRRVMMKAAGYSDEDIRQKPHIGIPNSYMAGSPGTAHLRQVTEAVKEGIWAAGGIPVEFGIPATCGNVANGADEMKYEQVGRDIVAMSIEFVSRIHNFDAICCVASCDLIIAGCYLAACRLDIPALVVTGGSMQAGNYCGKTVVEADLDAARFSGASEAELFEMEESVCPSFGACPSMGTVEAVAFQACTQIGGTSHSNGEDDVITLLQFIQTLHDEAAYDSVAASRAEVHWLIHQNRDFSFFIGS